VVVDPGVLAAAVGALDSLDGAITTDPHDGSLIIAAPDGTADLLRVVRQLDGAGITPHAIELRRPSLNDVFLSLTADPTPAMEPTA